MKNLVEPQVIEVNTVQGAKDYISQDRFFSEDYVLYTAAVVRKCLGFAKILDLTDEQKETLTIAGYLHNTGRFLVEKKRPIHQHNAYFTLKELGWKEDVCLLVLHHLDAYGLRKLIAPNLTAALFNEPLPERLVILDRILTISSLLTGPRGEHVTLAERIDLGVSRYHSEHVRVRHLRNITRQAHVWLDSILVGNSDDLNNHD